MEIDKTSREETTTRGIQLCNCSHRSAVNAWISKVELTVDDAGLGDLTTEKLAQRMWNCDKTAFATDVATKRILVKKGNILMKQVVGQAESTHTCITVLGCGSASSQHLLSYVLKKR